MPGILNADTLNNTLFNKNKKPKYLIILPKSDCIYMA